MENITEQELFMRRQERAHQRGKVAGGLLLLTAGSLFLARELGYVFPDWLFSWKMLLIAIGLVSGIKHGFRRVGWLIAITIGVAFIIADLYPEFSIKPFILPVVLILAGLFIIFRPSRRRCSGYWHKKRYGHKYGVHGAPADPHVAGRTDDADFIDTTSFMGGAKRNVISKQFRGGDITNVFGGSELNLMQADFEDTATLEVTQVFGGTKLIIPANWQIRSSVVTIFGGVEDKRSLKSVPDSGKTKVLVLEGTNFFGGIEISSY
jgi:predicted membrane protein